MSKQPLTHWLWFDYETTGLYQGNTAPALLEMAAILLPFGELDPDKGTVLTNRVFKAQQGTWLTLDPFVQKMHTANGLWAAAVSAPSASTPTVSMYEVLHGLEAHDIKPRQCAPAGSGIAPFDLPLMREKMTKLYDYLYYTPYDMGAGRRMLSSIWGATEVDEPDTDPTHRALDDVLGQLAEARQYRTGYRLQRT